MDPLWTRFSVLSREEQDQILVASLDSLAKEDAALAETLIRVAYHEQTFDEVAKAMHVVKGTVSKRQRKAVDRIRTMLQILLDARSEFRLSNRK